MLQMKKIILLLLTSASIYFAGAQSLKTPAPSTTQNIKQEFGLGSIDLSYARPNMKGRAIFGDLVPYGAIWRTGANSATTLTFSDDVIIGGTSVPAGKYGLLTMPGAAEWTVIITKQLDVTSPSAYKKEMDVLRTVVPVQNLPFPIETFTIMFNNVRTNEIDLVLLWDQTTVALPIKQDIDSKVMAQIDNLMNKDNKPYFNAAMYYMDNGKDLAKATAWLDKAVEQTPTAYWVWYQKARCLSMLKKNAEAKTASLKSLELAKTAKNPDYVTLNEKLLAGLK